MPVNTWGPLILILVLPLHRCVLALYMFTQYFPKFCENQRVYGANTVMVKPKFIFISRTWICIKIGVYLHIFIYFCCKKPLLCWTFGVILCEMFVWYFCNILMINIWMFFMIVKKIVLDLFCQIVCNVLYVLYDALMLYTFHIE